MRICGCTKRRFGGGRVVSTLNVASLTPSSSSIFGGGGDCDGGSITLGKGFPW